MSRLNHRFTRFSLSLALTILVALGAALPAFADDTGGGNTNLTVSAGSLQFTAAPSLGDLTGITLDGTKQTTDAALSAFTIADATGSGLGWHVTVQATQFKEWNGTAYVLTNTLPMGSLIMSQPTVAPATDVTSPAPTITGGPYTIDNGSAVSIASANAGDGMGKYNFGATTLTLTVYPDVYVANYRSAFTMSVISAP